jgi:hypothetical protein
MAMLDLLDFFRTEYKPGPGQYLPIDMAKLAEKLNVRDLGRERGRQGLPNANSSNFDEIETQITEGIRAYALEEEARTHEQLIHYGQRLQAADPRGIAADMRAIAIESVAKFDAEALAAKSELESARAELEERKQDLRDFKVQNRLQRPVTPPKNHILMGGLLAVLFLIETAPNAVLFGAGDEAGVLGGYAIAIVFSFLNLAFGYAAGRYCWTNTLHRNPLRKALGVILGTILVGLIAGLNLLVAHFREFTGAGIDTSRAAQRAWELLVDHPFGLNDALSIGLATMGVLFALIAMADGFAWNDPYPGYSAIANYRAEAERAWSRLVDERLSFLDDVQKRHADELKAARGRLHDRQASIPDILAQRARLLRNFDLHIQHLAGVGRYVLSAYRDANRAAREAGNAVPAHFDEAWELKGVSLADTTMAAPSASDTDWKVADDALESSMEKLQRGYQEAIAWIRSLSSQASDTARSDTHGAPN